MPETGDGGGGPCPPLFAEPQEDIFFYHLDHLGTPLFMTDDNKIVRWSADYFPFGEVYAEQTNETNQFRFPGQYADEETGLYYNSFRYYEAMLGRYASSDPIGLTGGLNRYLYVGGNPIIGSDRLGLSTSNCNKDFRTCVGKARVLLGNPRHIGRSGAFGKKVKINLTSAAIDPYQWGGKTGLLPHLARITGRSDSKLLFTNIADVIGGTSPIKEQNVRDALRELYPNTLLIELPGGEKDYGIVDIELTIPKELDCPEGTTEAK